VTADKTDALRALLVRQEIASLGTLHGGEPSVSMVPYALMRGGALVIHVSSLATHTRDMERHAGVSMMVLGERAPQVMPQALPRAIFQGEARRCAVGDAEYGDARQAYLARFPQSEEMFGFADFSLFLIVPGSVRFVGGFGNAWSVSGQDYAVNMSLQA
jgi:putative heme iron utilization protein